MASKARRVAPRSRTQPEVPFGRRVAHREYLWRPRVGKPRVVQLAIGTPAPTPSEWACRVRISGLPRERDLDQVVYGVDSVQALELALQFAGRTLAAAPEFRAGQIEAFGAAAHEPAALFLPLPMHSLQNALESLRTLLERKLKSDVRDQWQRALVPMMREISLDLATLATHLPVRPRRRRRM